ncbi:MAG: hypothetical protein ACXAD7_03565 [Candidatus Kariarchaeaceae archaeon]|jgi:hypothetical protein
MTEDKQSKKEKADECHKFMAVDCFNKAWEYIEMEDRTPEDDDMMIYATMSSRYHWGKIGTPLNFARGEWQISRVFSILNRGQDALHHAEQCLKLTEEHDFKDFDLAFAYECRARASASMGNQGDFKKYFQLAEEAGEKIEGEGDRDYFFKDLKSGNWFGMK